jgi:crossover junction endodeoxyribonuclease RusA
MTDTSEAMNVAQRGAQTAKSASPEPMRPRIALFVPGTPAPQGSKRHVGNGRMIESSAAVGPWRERVALAAHNALRASAQRPMVGPVTVILTFWMPRPKSARAGAAATKRPDLDKLVRAVLDALTGIAFVDDSQVIRIDASKSLTGVGWSVAGCEIDVWEMS